MWLMLQITLSVKMWHTDHTILHVVEEKEDRGKLYTMMYVTS